MTIHPEELFIEGPAGRLEAVWQRVASPVAAAVLAHPHPLYGGTLGNPVIFHAAKALTDCGWSTLRFNFRGVGTSEGKHDDGNGELEDLAAAVSWLRARQRSMPLLLVGYSFGAWCAIRYALRDPGIRALVGIGLPVTILDCEPLVELARPLAVVQGGADELGPPELVRGLLERADPPGRLYVVEGAPHTFPAQASLVEGPLREAAAHCLGQMAAGIDEA
jgi:alpha/beta superfamily hydrolase